MFMTISKEDSKKAKDFVKKSQKDNLRSFIIRIHPQEKNISFQSSNHNSEYRTMSIGFENQYTIYVKNCVDTFRIKVNLRIDADGRVSIASISPNTFNSHNKEIERIVKTVKIIKSSSKDSIEINHRVLCLDE